MEQVLLDSPFIGTPKKNVRVMKDSSAFNLATYYTSNKPAPSSKHIKVREKSPQLTSPWGKRSRKQQELINRTMLISLQHRLATVRSQQGKERGK